MSDQRNKINLKEHTVNDYSSYTLASSVYVHVYMYTLSPLGYGCRQLLGGGEEGGTKGGREGE